MNDNAMVITALCSHLCAGESLKPLTLKEWNALAKSLAEHGLEPKSLLELPEAERKDVLSVDSGHSERISRLLDRSASLTFALNKLHNIGIFVVTRSDQNYPQRLKKLLGSSSPALFYCAGDLDLLNTPAIGYAGSRSASEEDIQFTVSTVQKTVSKGYFVVSGGAKGVDTAAEEAALGIRSCAISFLSDSMLRKIKRPAVLKALQENRMLLLSAVNPDAGFQPGIAMMRNRYIFAHSSGTVIIRSDYNKGGTWSGATENLRHRWSPTLCWNNPRYAGNRALIQQGAIPIDEGWDGDPAALPPDGDGAEQLSLFS